MLQAGPVDADVGEHGGVDLGLQAVDGASDVGGLADVEREAVAGGGEGVDEMGVGRAAEADAEHAGAAIGAALTLDEGPRAAGDRLLLAGVAVGEEGDVAVAAGGDGALERGLHGAAHLGAAVGLEAVDEVEGAAQVGGAGGAGLGEQALAAAGEDDDVEGVDGAHAGEGLAHGGPGEGEREALHRAGDVDDEDELAGADEGVDVEARWFDDEHEVAAVGVGGAEEDACGRLGGGAAVAEDEVAVGDLVAAGELEVEAVLGGEDLDLVAGHGPVVDRRAGLGDDLDADVVAAAQPVAEHGRGDPRAVRDPAAAGDVARADDGGEHELVLAGVVAEGLGVADLDLDRGAAGDVGDRLGEDVGALLLEQGGGVAGVAGLAVDRGRLGALADLAGDHAVADRHAHVGDGGVLGEGEGVDGLEGGVAVVDEALLDGDLGRVAAQLGAHVGAAQGEGDAGVEQLRELAGLGVDDVADLRVGEALGRGGRARVDGGRCGPRSR
jgi:hypothetical protein